MPADRIRGSSIGPYKLRNRRDSYSSQTSDFGPSRPTSPNGFRPYDYQPMTPGNSRPGTPNFGRQQTVRNSKKSNSSSQKYTSILAPASPPFRADESLSNSMELDNPSTVTWECATAIVENQKVQTSYEKPVQSESGEIVSYGKMLTKTITMTITTTIASTEILHPGQEGYDDSMDRYKQQLRQANGRSPKETTSPSNNQASDETSSKNQQSHTGPGEHDNQRHPASEGSYITSQVSKTLDPMAQQ